MIKWLKLSEKLWRIKVKMTLRTKRTEKIIFGNELGCKDGLKPRTDLRSMTNFKPKKRIKKIKYKLNSSDGLKVRTD